MSNNKMPEVGKRYISRRSGNLMILDRIGTEFVFLIADRRGYAPEKVHREEFWEYFEELPSKEEPKSFIEKLLNSVEKIQGKDFANEVRKNLEEDNSINPQEPQLKNPVVAEEDISKKETTEKQCAKNAHTDSVQCPKSDSVHRAKEELRDYFCRSLLDCNDIVAAMQHYRELKEKAQAVVDALDEREKQENIGKELEPICYAPDGYEVKLFQNGEVISAIAINKDGKTLKRVISPTLQKDWVEVELLTENRENPVSCPEWKDVSELPEGIEQIILRYKDGGLYLARASYGRLLEINQPINVKTTNLEKYCLLNDFFNQTERVSKKVEEMERKFEILEMKICI